MLHCLVCKYNTQVINTATEIHPHMTRNVWGGDRRKENIGSSYNFIVHTFIQRYAKALTHLSFH